MCVCARAHAPPLPLQLACFLVTALLHLFFMASFSWMLVEGLLLWSKVVSVNISEDHRMKLYYVTGWGKLFVVLLLGYLEFSALLLSQPAIITRLLP